MNTQQWEVRFSHKAAKQKGKLPQAIQDSLLALATDAVAVSKLRLLTDSDSDFFD